MDEHQWDGFYYPAIPCAWEPQGICDACKARKVTEALTQQARQTRAQAREREMTGWRQAKKIAPTKARKR